MCGHAGKAAPASHEKHTRKAEDEMKNLEDHEIMLFTKKQFNEEFCCALFTKVDNCYVDG